MLLFGTVLCGVAALTSAPGGRACRAAMWALTGSTLVVFGVMVGAVIGTTLPSGTYAVYAIVPPFVLAVSAVQARRLRRRIASSRETMQRLGSSRSTHD